MNTLKAMWADLPAWGKVAMMVIAALLLVAAMVAGYSLQWFPAWLGGQ